MPDQPMDEPFTIEDAIAGKTSDAAAAKEAGADASDPAQRVEELQNRLLRSQAELENFRKRIRREMDDERRFAELPLLTDLLPVLDNIDRAISAAEKTSDAGSLLAGFKMLSGQLRGVLERHNCKPIEAQGQPFDPALHEAIMQQPSADHPENTVTGVAQGGFTLHDRVVRPAQVIVSSKPK
ncbi:MAG: nucleotide exchange factor GrpE [Planctomycetota bacterium]|nr:nucleotide exchange factor GrpE [Planctomycetota bacterium]